MKEDSFCIFMFFLKAIKISGLEGVGGISCYSTNPSLSTFAIKIKVWEISGWRIVFKVCEKFTTLSMS